MKIFSYGSNMCSPRMTARVPSARFVATGYVRGFTLRFHKRGRLDGSGKANMLRTDAPDDRVWGVIWSIDPVQKPDLDRAEGFGNGYEEERVRVVPEAGMSGPKGPGDAEETGREMCEEIREESAPRGRRKGDVRPRAYIASPDFVDDRPVPFEWYLAFVLAGAREHGLPDAYVEAIARRESRRDPNASRRRRNRRILESGRERGGEGTAGGSRR